MGCANCNTLFPDIEKSAKIGYTVWDIRRSVHC